MHKVYSPQRGIETMVTKKNTKSPGPCRVGARKKRKNAEKLQKITKIAILP